MTEPLYELLHRCCLCPRHCEIDRLRGERGFCRLTDRMVIDCALVHHGEEPPISGICGSGTIFFSSCNLRCLFCQNYQISHSVRGYSLSPEELAAIMQSLAAKGCHNINLITPTPHLPFIVTGLRRAREQGLTLPVVYNTGGYENAEIIRQLEGWIDIYMPDVKFGTDETAFALSRAEHYVDHTMTALAEMARQVGDRLILHEGIAEHGLIVRHLVLPGMLDNSLAVVNLIASFLSTRVTLSLMSQYTPIPKVAAHPDLHRRITREEYETIVDYALDRGFENIYIQDVDERHLSPDFSKDTPFAWYEEKKENS